MLGLCTMAGKAFDQCWKESGDYRSAMSQPYWPPVLTIAFVPIPLFWFFGWIAIKATRWVRAGFVQ